jgi:hypothetical protein
MLRKYSIIMMVLLVAASLIGINSIYQPANIETQPQPPANTRGLVTQKDFQSTSQILNDALLLDRLFPQIIKRIDGNTLLQKIDGKLLAQKVLPYLSVNPVVTYREGQMGQVKGIGIDPPNSSMVRTANCLPDEVRVSGGFTLMSGRGGDIWMFNSPPNVANGWEVGASTADGRLYPSVYCLKAEVILQEPRQQEQQPPGGPPL